MGARVLDGNRIRDEIKAELNTLEENIGAAAIELTADDLRDIDSAASKITVEGARYPERLERMTGL